MREYGIVTNNLPVKLTRIRSRIDRSERVYHILKDAVIHRQFTPGVWIKQEQISQAIGISRTTVRPVLARLQSEGLIEARPRKGFRVVEFSQEELDDLFEVREVLETAFFTRSAQTIPLEELQMTLTSLENAEYKMKEAKPGSELWDDRLREYLELDRAFHDRLIEASGNKQWRQMYLNTRDKIEIIGYQASYIPTQLSNAIEQHSKIIKALLKQDFKNAELIMREHIRNVRRSIKLDGAGNTMHIVHK
jgi:DNA-binding GntR family transcriptional regulator